MIFKIARREDPFIQIDKAVYENEYISYKAKGILTYLMGRPEDWVIYETEIAKHTPEGIKSIRSGINELIKYGYVIKTTIRNKKGQFMANEWLVYDIPTERPKTACRKKHTTNIESNNIDIVKGNAYKSHKKDGSLRDLHLQVTADIAAIEVNNKRLNI